MLEKVYERICEFGMFYEVEIWGIWRLFGRPIVVALRIVKYK